MNHTYTCFHPQQRIAVALSANGWLHTGSLVCPDCQDVCGPAFSARGQQCEVGVLPPKDHVYHEDVLTCGGAANHAVNAWFLLLLSWPLVLLWRL